MEERRLNAVAAFAFPVQLLEEEERADDLLARAALQEMDGDDGRDAQQGPEAGQIPKAQAHARSAAGCSASG